MEIATATENPFSISEEEQAVLLIPVAPAQREATLKGVLVTERGLLQDQPPNFANRPKDEGMTLILPEILLLTRRVQGLHQVLTEDAKAGVPLTVAIQTGAVAHLKAAAETAEINTAAASSQKT